MSPLTKPSHPAYDFPDGALVVIDNVSHCPITCVRVQKGEVLFCLGRRVINKVPMQLFLSQHGFVYMWYAYLSEVM